MIIFSGKFEKFTLEFKSVKETLLPSHARLLRLKLGLAKNLLNAQVFFNQPSSVNFPQISWMFHSQLGQILIISICFVIKFNSFVGNSFES